MYVITNATLFFIGKLVCICKCNRNKPALISSLVVECKGRLLLTIYVSFTVFSKRTTAHWFDWILHFILPYPCTFDKSFFPADETKLALTWKLTLWWSLKQKLWSSSATSKYTTTGNKKNTFELCLLYFVLLICALK